MFLGFSVLAATEPSTPLEFKQRIVLRGQEELNICKTYLCKDGGPRQSAGIHEHNCVLYPFLQPIASQEPGHL